ncbi:hypothetical protein O9929_17040 [Vibrio lentus]|nr:hypothetical protein [Vibrio lentus]
MNNNNNEMIFSVSGYGEERPLEGHRHPGGKQMIKQNRRDLRLHHGRRQSLPMQKKGTIYERF